MIRADAEELAAHASRLEAIAAVSGSCVWTALESSERGEEPG